MCTALVALMAALSYLATAAWAQAPGVTSDIATSSTPGKAAVVSTTEVTATIVSIDRSSRTLTLKGPRRTLDVTADDGIRNFDALLVGDRVLVRYVESLSVEIRTTRAPRVAAGDGAVARSPAGARPGAAVGREVTSIADVVGIDEKNRSISLRVPSGNVIDLKVHNPDHFKVVKVGDQVEAVYTTALALTVMPAAAKPSAGGK